MRKLKTSTAIILAVAAAACGQSAWAQEQPASENLAGDDQADDSDIVVTAQRREERLLDVPQSVTAISGDDLKKLGATQFRDFANTVPGLVFQTSGAGATQVSLRGVTAGTDVSATVGIYVDEVPYGTSTAFGRSGRYTPDGNVQDIARVEVLRGPQGTLYGASAMGGVLKYVSKLPDSTAFGVDARAGISHTRYGGTNYDAGAALNLPIAEEKVALRVSGFYSKDGGFVDSPRLNRKNINRAEIYGARADLLLTPTEALTIRIAGEFQNIERQGAGEVDYTFGFLNAPAIAGDLTQDRFIEEPFSSRFRIVSGTVTYDFGGATLTSVTSYQETRALNNYDYTKAGVFGPGITLLTDEPGTDKFSQELRLSASLGSLIDFTVGGFFTNEKSVRVSEIIYRDPDTGVVVPDLYALSAPSKYKEYAGFANVTLNVTEQFDITGGIRAARNEQVYSQTGIGFAGNRPETRSSEDVVTYLANARYQFSSNATAYIRFATGYRPGGPNFVAVGFPNASTFDADRLESYEIGFKGQTDDRSFAIDAALYHIDWKDIQTFDLSSPFGGYINGPRATIEGGEIALTARPAEGLVFSGSFALQDARLAEDSADLQASKGDRLPNVPQYTAALNGDYEVPFGEFRPTIGATFRFVSDRTSGFSQSASRRKLNDYTQLDLRAGGTIGSVNLQAFVRNVFDTRGQLSSFSPDGMPPRVAITQPRTIGLNTSIRF